MHDIKAGYQLFPGQELGIICLSLSWQWGNIFEWSLDLHELTGDKQEEGRDKDVKYPLHICHHIRGLGSTNFGVT